MSQDEPLALEITKKLVCEDADLDARAWYQQFEWQEGPKRSASFLRALTALDATLQEFWLVYHGQQVLDVPLALDLLAVFKRRVMPKTRLSIADLRGELGESLLIN